MGQWKKLRGSQESPLKGTTMDLGLMKTYSLWASAPGQSWKSISGIWGESEESAIRASARRQLPPGQNARGQAAALPPL